MSSCEKLKDLKEHEQIEAIENINDDQIKFQAAAQEFQLTCMLNDKRSMR